MKEPSHQQKRWNRHWNYRMDDDKLARAIFDGARGKLHPKDALACADYIREDMAAHIAESMRAHPQEGT